MQRWLDFVLFLTLGVNLAGTLILSPSHSSSILSKQSRNRYTAPPRLRNRYVDYRVENEDWQSANETENRYHLLMYKLFRNYIKEAVPEMPVVVHFDILLMKLKASVEMEGIFESVVGLFIEWKDKRMEWDPAEFANLTVLTFDADRVWLPDIAMTNSAEHLYAISRDFRFVVRVSHNGVFKFVPTGTARTWCDFKLLTYPFDYQICTLKFESWSMNSSSMTFDGKSQLLLDSQFSSTEWSLCLYRALTYDQIYDFTNEAFTRVEFEFVVKRKSTFYVINLIFPCATLSIIQNMVFLIPSTDTTVDRIGFGTTNLLTLVVFQTIVTAEMPKTSDAVTALSKYIIALITLSTFAIFESVVVERLLSSTMKPPSWRLLRCLNSVPILWRDSFYAKMTLYGRFEKQLTQPSCRGSRRQFSVDLDVSGSAKESTAEQPRPNEASEESQRKYRKTIRERGTSKNLRNIMAWHEIAYRIDFIAFVLCACLALFIPLMLFLPLSLVSDECTDNSKNYQHYRTANN